MQTGVTSGPGEGLAPPWKENQGSVYPAGWVLHQALPVALVQNLEYKSGVFHSRGPQYTVVDVSSL